MPVILIQELQVTQSQKARLDAKIYSNTVVAPLSYLFNDRQTAGHWWFSVRLDGDTSDVLCGPGGGVAGLLRHLASFVVRWTKPQVGR